MRRLGRSSPPTPRQELLGSIRARHPRLGTALAADAQIFARMRGDAPSTGGRASTVRTILQQAWVSDAFFAMACYRLKAHLQRLRVPVLPQLAHRLAMLSAQVCIGDPVVIHPGVYLPHGQVVIDGIVEIEPQVSIRPWVTIGLKEGNINGPTIKRGAQIGTGAKLFGPITVGARSHVGANAVVIDDVAPGATVVGVPARPVVSPP